MSTDKTNLNNRQPQPMTQPRPLQLLAPARDLETGRQAILHGADAVYIGASAFGARYRAGNSVDDIKRLAEFAAPLGQSLLHI